MTPFEKINKLRIRLNERLPGAESHLKMVPQERRELLKQFATGSVPKASSVLILLYPANDSIETILIRRSQDLSVHSGQISFPGGKRDETDQSAIDTALREAEEEIGVNRNAIEILGTLSPLYVHPSNFEITPVIGFCKEPGILKPNPTEVDEVIRISLTGLTGSKKYTDIEVRGYTLYQVPCFSMNGHIIWGATAMILQEMLDVTAEIN